MQRTPMATMAACERRRSGGAGVLASGVGAISGGARGVGAGLQRGQRGARQGRQQRRGERGAEQRGQRAGVQRAQVRRPRLLRAASQAPPRQLQLGAWHPPSAPAQPHA